MRKQKLTHRSSRSEAAAGKRPSRSKSRSASPHSSKRLRNTYGHSRLDLSGSRVVSHAHAARAISSQQGTPSKPKRRPQPRLNGYASSSSLGLGSSLSSSTVLSSSSRPRYTRQGSNLTPDQDRDREAYILTPSFGAGTPSRRRPRSRSAGEDSFDFGESSSTSANSRQGWMSRSRSGLSSPGGLIEEEGLAVLLTNAEELVRHLKGLAREGAKGKSRDQEGAAGDGLMRLAALLKKSDELRTLLGKDETIRRYAHDIQAR